MIYKELSRQRVTFKEHWVWSNGFAGQFKSVWSFLWLSHLHINMDVHHTWRFFGTRHGKGEHGSAGAYVKCPLRRYQMNHSTSHLSNSNDVVNWCKQNLSHEFNERMGNVRRFFWNIAMGDVDSSMQHNCTAIHKTRGLHSIRSNKMTNIHAIEKRKYSLFCLACIDDVESLDEYQN